jgi:hypothetical protein
MLRALALLACLSLTASLGPSAPPLPLPRPRVHLVTFGGCRSAQRLPAFVREARRSGFFDLVRAATPADLPARLTNATRGCGYWAWKPQAVLQALRLLPPGGVLVYADSGSSLHPENCGLFWRYVSLAAAQPTAVVSFEMAAARAPRDAAWCKADAALALRATPDHLASPQLHATYFFLARSPATLALVTAWRDAAVAQDGHLIDDSPSLLAAEPPGFVAHRHDQCLFSLLRKQQARVVTVPDDAARGWAPIQSTRCRSGKEAACAVRRLKEAAWALARERRAGLESIADAEERRRCPSDAKSLLRPLNETNAL